MCSFSLTFKLPEILTHHSFHFRGGHGRPRKTHKGCGWIGCYNWTNRNLSKGIWAIKYSYKASTWLPRSRSATGPWWPRRLHLDLLNLGFFCSIRGRLWLMGHKFLRLTKCWPLVRLFSVSGRLFMSLIWTMIVLIAMWTIAFFFANFFQCVPLYINWVGEGVTDQNCIDETSLYIGQAYSDIISDGNIPCVIKQSGDANSLSADSLHSHSIGGLYYHYAYLSFVDIFKRYGDSICQPSAKLPWAAFSCSDHCKPSSPNGIAHVC